MFQYEMHVHSAPCSGGGADIEDHIRTLIDKGFSGMVITNHFYRGDTRIDRELPWKDFVAQYRLDYERGKRLADALDFDVLFGIEEHVGKGREVLIYGITPELLEQNEVLRAGRVADYVRLVHQAGGLIFQAHPYRARDYIKEPGPLSELAALDGVEVYNASNTPEENEAAAVLAKKMGLRCIAGSDGHSVKSVGRAGIVARERITDNAKLIEILKNGAYELNIPE